MSNKLSIKSYILLWVCGLAVSMSLLLSYQSSQFFLQSFQMMISKQMFESANLLPQDKESVNLQFGYRVASGWEHVPAEIKTKFAGPPEKPGELLKHLENWWYFAPPEAGYFLMLAYNQSGEARYISKIIKKNDKSIRQNQDLHAFHIDPMVKIALWGLAALLIFIALIYRVFRNLASPIDALYSWAGSLKLESLEKEVPDFQYQELNALSTVIHNKIEDVALVLEREKEFLSYASHELRTPIATLRSNATLLDKVSPNPSTKELEVRERILRASLTMKGITETLLWLNRDSQELLPYVDTDIEDTLKQTVTELKYLLVGKDIELTINTQPCKKQLPEAAFRILVTNVIRNSFQHTTEGIVRIEQTDNLIMVKNGISNQQQTHAGFGLGLKLIHKIVNRFGWEMTQLQIDDVNIVTIKF